jgi:hypothetical protein
MIGAVAAAVIAETTHPSAGGSVPLKSVPEAENGQAPGLEPPVVHGR